MNKKFGFENPAYNLSAFRVLLSGLILVSIFSQILPADKDNLKILLAGHHLFPFHFSYNFFVWMDSRFLSLQVLECWALLLGFCVLLGAQKRFGQFFMLMALLLYAPVQYQFSEGFGFYCTQILFFALAGLAFLPEVHRYGARELLRGPKAEYEASLSWWPQFYFLALVPVAFANSVVSKVVNGGVGWFNGDALQAYFYMFYLSGGSEFALFMAQSKLLNTVLTVATLIFEASFLLVIFFSRVRSFYVAAGMFFHLATFLIFRLDFITTFSTIYLIYFDYSGIYKEIRQWLDRSELREA